MHITPVQPKVYFLLLMLLLGVFTNLVIAQVPTNICILSFEDITTEASFCSGKDGEIKVEASGGIAPYSYRINGGPWQAQNIFTGLGSGSYTVEVSYGDFSCSEDRSIFVGRQEAPVIENVLTVQPSDCSNPQGSITVQARGDGSTPLQYSLDNGATWQNSNTFSAPPGIYVVSVRYQHQSCVGATAPATIASLPPAPSVLHSSSRSSQCANNDGSITLNASGGLPPYSYKLGSSAWQNSNTFTQLSAGVYTAFVRNANSGCETIVQVTVPKQPAPVIQGAPITPPADCANQIGVISVFASGEAGTHLEYSLDNGVTWQNNSSFSVAPGNYLISVRYQGQSCKVDYGQVKVDPMPSAPSVSVTTSKSTFCENTQGKIVVHTSGGVVPFSFRLNSGPWQSSNTFSGLSEGTYTVEVRNANNGCQTTINTSVGRQSAPSIYQVTATHPFSCADLEGSLTVYADGEPGVSLEYTIDGINWKNNPVFTVPPGTYYVKARYQGQLCDVYYYDSTVVNSPPTSPKINLEIRPASYCSGTGGQIIVHASEGKPPYLYQLGNGGALVETNSFSNLSPGAYWIWVNNSDNSCSSYQIGIVDRQPPPGIDSVVVTHPEQCSTAAGGIRIYPKNVSGEVLEYSINAGGSWSDNPVFSNLAQGSYNIMVRYRSQPACSVSHGTVSINPPSSKPVIYSYSAPRLLFCQTSGSLTISAGGGQPPYEYRLDSGPWQSSAVLTNATPGEHIISVRNASGGCISSAPAVVEQQQAPEVNQVNLTDAANCATASGQIQIQGQSKDFATDGSLKLLQFSINSGASWSASNTFNVVAGIYPVGVRYAGENCALSQGNVTIINAGAPRITAVNLIPVPCGGQTGQIQIVATSSGGGSLSYRLNNGAWQSGNTFSVAAGVYTIEVTSNTSAANCKISYGPVTLGGSSGCTEWCGDGIDNDGDGLVDGADPDCPGSCPPKGTACNDGNPNTINDKYDNNCICTGTPIVNEGVYLEAECGEVGNQWTSPESMEASNNRVVQAPGSIYPTSAPTNTGFHIRWTFQVSQSKGFSIFARIKSNSTASDAFWVKINGNAWFKWDNLHNGSSSGQYRWVQLSPSGSGIATYLLPSGLNSLTFAACESGVLLDKIHITSSPIAPTGMGDNAPYLCIPCLPSGVACDDGNPGTFNDVWNGACTCAGQPCPVAGTPCDDGDPRTINDQQDGQCNCVGTLPCPVAGTPCDDGKANTVNDVQDGNCYCTGVPIAGVGGVYLEAECSEWGSQWTPASGSEASNGRFLQTPAQTHLFSAPTDEAFHLQWSFQVAQTTSYYVFVRVKTTNNSGDAFWVRFNNNAWFLWDNIDGGSTGNQYAWVLLTQRLPNRTTTSNFFLSAGLNSLSFGGCENGFSIDKIFITPSYIQPSGMGGAAPDTCPPCAPAGSPCNDGNPATVNDVQDGACNCAGQLPVSLWLEAECGLVGSQWTRSTGAQASNNRYLLAASTVFPTDPPSNAGHLLQYTFNVPQTGQYRLYARVSTAASNPGALWGRLDNGSWFKTDAFTTSPAGAFAWINLHGAGSSAGFMLSAGTHTLNLAAAAGGFSIDKLFISSGSELPSALGGAATDLCPCPPSGAACDDGNLLTYNDRQDGNCNCVGTPCSPAGTPCDDGNPYTINDKANGSCGCVGTAIDPASDIWLEVECAQIGSLWTRRKNANASNGSYVAPPNISSLNSPPGNPEDLLVLRFNVLEAAVYRLFARVSAPNSGGDSYWLRMDNGPWIKWDKINAGMYGESFHWATPPEENSPGGSTPAVFPLQAGEHMLSIAWREPYALLDKIFLTAANAVPSGFGFPAADLCPCPEPGTACDDGNPATYNDAIGENCQCVGIPCPPAGTACDDGDPATFNDQSDGYCYCIGIPCPPAGTACDDGDPATFRDQENGLCECIGIPCPPAGTACDDGDPWTFNDLSDGNCGCSGEPVDPDSWIWLEAECADIGDDWEIEADPDASNQLVLASNAAGNPTAPPYALEQTVRWSFQVQQSGPYFLFARIRSRLNGSYWVRLDDGEWQLFDSLSINQSGFQWAGMTSDSELRLIPLEVGVHTLTFAVREPGLQLDKLNLALLEEEPQGLGGLGEEECPLCLPKGLPCDDGDPSTINDRLDGRCHCVGEGIAGEDKTVCPGEEVTLGRPDNSFDTEHCYIWVPSYGLDNPQAPNPKARPDISTTYTAIKTSIDSVVAIANVTVNVIERKEISISPNSAVFCSGSLTLEATEGFQNYVWTDEQGKIIGNQRQVNIFSSGRYTVTAKDGVCLKDVSASVDVPEAFQASISPNPAVICPGDTLILDGGSGYTQYSWSTGEHDQTIEISQAGYYQLTVVNQEGCVDTTDITVHDPNDANSIKDYFLGKGFYSIPITILGDATLRQDSVSFRNDEYVVDLANLLIQIKGDQFNIKGDLEEILADILFEGINLKGGFITKNENFCAQSLSFEEIEAQFNQLELGYWVHLWKNPDGGEDCLLAWANVPHNIDHSPVSSEHRGFIDEVLNLVEAHASIYDFRSKDAQMAYSLFLFLSDCSVTYELPAEQTSGSSACGLNTVSASIAPSGIVIPLPAASIMQFRLRRDLIDQIDNLTLTGFIEGGENIRFVGIAKIKAQKFLGYIDPLSKTMYAVVSPTDDRVIIGGTTPYCEVYYFGTTYSTNLYHPEGAGPFVPDFQTSGTLGNDYFLLKTKNYCLPNITQDQIEGSVYARLYFFGKNSSGNLGDHGVMSKVMVNGEEILVFTIYPYESDDPIHYRWNCVLGIWEQFYPTDIEEQDILSAVFQAFFETGHLALDIGGSIPLIGTGFDIANGLWYTLEGKGVDATLSFASVVPVLDIVGKVGALAWQTKGTVVAGSFFILIRKISKTGEIVNFEKIREAINAAALTPAQAKNLSDWLLNNEEALLAFYRNPGLVKAWKGLFNTGLRTDIPWLTRASKWIDEGGDFVESGGKTWFRKNGDDIFEIKNEKILPNKKSNYHQGSGGTPIGEPANGYQVVKIGDDIKVKRVPDETPYQSGDYLTKLKEHPNAHTLDRHGHDVTDDALLKRANEGIAPDGSTIGNSPPYTLPPYSSKFDSPDALKEAYDNTKPGSTAFNNTTENPVGTKKVFHTKSLGNYGKGVAAGQSNFQNTNLVRATYVKNANGDWQLITMFPDF